MKTKVKDIMMIIKKEEMEDQVKNINKVQRDKMITKIVPNKLKY